MTPILAGLDPQREYLLAYKRTAQPAGWFATPRLGGPGPGEVGALGDPVRLTDVDEDQAEYELLGAALAAISTALPISSPRYDPVRASAVEVLADVWAAFLAHGVDLDDVAAVTEMPRAVLEVLAATEYRNQP